MPFCTKYSKAFKSFLDVARKSETALSKSSVEPSLYFKSKSFALFSK